MLTEAEILDALRVCFDPELPVNIVDLGLVYGIAVFLDLDAPGVDPRYRVSVKLTMRMPNDEREPMLLGQVKNRLAGIQAISRSDVQLVRDPVWNPERMTQAARQQLGLDLPAQMELVQIRL